MKSSYALKNNICTKCIKVGRIDDFRHFQYEDFPSFTIYVNIHFTD